MFGISSSCLRRHLTSTLFCRVVGRACGYGKNSLVILSDQNHRILDTYVATHGDYVMTPSRHSVVAGGVNSLEQRRQITIERDPADPCLRDFSRMLIFRSFCRLFRSAPT